MSPFFRFINTHFFPLLKTHEMFRIYIITCTFHSSQCILDLINITLIERTKAHKKKLNFLKKYLLNISLSLIRSGTYHLSDQFV